MARKSNFIMKGKSKGYQVRVADQILEVCEDGFIRPCDGSEYSDDCLAKMRNIPKLFSEQKVEVLPSKKEAAPDQPFIELVVVDSEEDIPVEQKAPEDKSPAKKKAAKKASTKKASKKKSAAKKKSAELKAE